MNVLKAIAKALGKLLLWLSGVALGVAVFFGGVLAVSYHFTTETKLPDAQVTLAGAQLNANGYRWHVPLLAAMLDKVFEQSPNLTVQKLGEVNESHPTLAVPDWVNYGELEIENEAGQIVFAGTLEEYNTAFAFAANGEYKASIRLWHLPQGMSAAQFDDTAGRVAKNPRLESPARPSGWYSYTVRFSLQATPTVILSAAETVQGSVVGVLLTGVIGTEAPVASCDLGPVVFEKTAMGWRGYLPVAYNAWAGEHTLTVTSGTQTAEAVIKVSGKDYGTAKLAADPGAESGSGGQQFRDKIWALYTAPSGGKAWMGRWVCPEERYELLISYGQQKEIAGEKQGQSNSSLLSTRAGDIVRAPASGKVAFAGFLQLTGNTVVIDHGCGVRTYLYGLQSLYVKQGMDVVRNGEMGEAGTLLTMDVKIGNKSVDPWTLVRGAGGLFWNE